AEVGAGDTPVVKRDVVGTDDNPLFLIDPLSPTAGATGAVSEDAAISTASGKLNAIDRDHAAALHWSVSTSPSGYASDYLFKMDALKIVKNGADFVNEEFNGNFTNQSLPPSLAGGVATSYQFGGLYSEAGGRLMLDGAVTRAIGGVGAAELIGGPPPALLTDLSSDLSKGLTKADAFTLHASYDPTRPGRGR